VRGLRNLLCVVNPSTKTNPFHQNSTGIQRPRRELFRDRGAGGSNTLVLTWPDARAGLNHEQALVQTSTDQGQTWSSPSNAAEVDSRRTGARTPPGWRSCSG